MNVCPVGATFATPEGPVLIDQERCIGCRICLEACMYDRRFFNWGQPPQPPEALLMEYSPEHQPLAFRGTVMKCDFCPDMARAGRLPYCAQGCPNKAIYYGDLEEDVATNGDVVVKLSRFVATNNGYRMKEELGTEPRVWYVPGHGQAVGRDPYILKGIAADELLQGLAHGETNREIGIRLRLSEKTITYYVTNVLIKLHVRSRVEAALLAQRASRE